MKSNTSRREFLRTMLGGAAVTLLPAGALLRPAAAKRKPLNFVFFLIDDFGWMDIGANNPHCFYDTPNIDRLARSGMNFTNGYAANLRAAAKLNRRFGHFGQIQTPKASQRSTDSCRFLSPL